MVRVKVLGAELGEGETAVVTTAYVARVALDGRITELSPKAARALALTDADALRVAGYYRKRAKPGRLVYEEVSVHVP